jgi:hypothetical protein
LNKAELNKAEVKEPTVDTKDPAAETKAPESGTVEPVDATNNETKIKAVTGN